MRDTKPALREQLATRLRRETTGEVLFSRADRGRYATDASIYQIEPVGVLVPRTIEDVATAMAIARESGVPVLPRGGGTSQCGQTVNRALVIDCSKYLRNVLEIDPERRRALVEPGIVLGHLNAALKPHGLFFPVDPSTHARCTIGGMAANNSCGSKSIRYGLMADNVAAIDAILADGARFRFGPDWPGQGATKPQVIGALMTRLQTLGQDLAPEIAARFPKVLRRVGGYNIDALTPAAAAEGRDNPGEALGRFGRNARLFGGDRADPSSHQAPESGGHLPVSFVSGRDGGDASSRCARSRSGGARRSHDDRPRPGHPDLPQHD